MYRVSFHAASPDSVRFSWRHAANSGSSTTPFGFRFETAAMETSWRGSRYGSGRSNSERTSVNTATLAEMPRPTQSTAAAVYPGRRANARHECLMSLPMALMFMLFLVRWTLRVAHLLPQAQRSHVRPDFVDIGQALGFRTDLAGVVPPERVVAISGPNGI